ncbi:hypothetical protein HGB25_02045, partial [Candidatus Saccharibacteria bacterium]|nr:hypothetical protein [Candidatus Saccharibacteria bacterium]
EILGDFSTSSEIIDKLITLIDFESEKRVNFGVSGYGNVNKSFVLKVGYDVKNRLADTGYTSRFVTGKTVDLSSVIVTENKLMERGFEAIILKSESGYLLGRTTQVQDYKSYSKRDFGRPVRDARNGMLPPKLAQIMINLAAQPVSSTIYDPFCGSGTILQEALFLGYRDIYGSDIEKKNIEDSRKNLDWLYTGFGMPKVAEDNLFISDVLEPSKTISAAAIVGEGYLGEPVRRYKDFAVKDSQKLAQFYEVALKQLREQLNPNGTIVLAIPFFVVGKEYIYLPILENIEKLGFTTISYIPKDLGIRLFGRGNLTYSRADQFVGREILVLKKS